MKLLSVSIMRGPNLWSNYRHKVIVAKLDLEALENFPTNKLDGFADRLQQWIPSIISHRCSKDYEGGFLERVREGTWMGHVIEHIALEIQTLAGMECGYGRTRETETQGIYNVVFSYELEQAGCYAAEAAVRIAEALAANMPYDLQKDLDELQQLKNRYALGPSTKCIVDAAIERNIPFRRLNNGGFVAFGQGKNQRRIRAAMSDATGSMGVDIAGDKQDTKDLLKKSFIPVPDGDAVSTWEGALELIREIGFPLVIKPLDGNQGKGVSTNINCEVHAKAAFNEAKKISNAIVIERYVTGSDYRFLVINYKLVAAARRTPAMIKGNGTATIAALIDEVNSDPARGEGHENVLTKIDVDHITTDILKRKGLNLDSVLPKGEVLFLKDTANLSTGGTARDITDWVHPFNVQMAERIARIVGLDICGIDIVAEDVNVPLDGKNGTVIEVNAVPGLRMHISPSKGLARNVGGAIMDMLFPENKPARVPVIAVTGTNGKTTTTRLIAHFAKTAGHHVGYTTTEGIYLNDAIIHHGDCSGPKSAETVLLEPTIDFAVLECARGGILRSGLGFDHCDVSVVTNVTPDHLGLKGINTIADLGKVKAVVPRSTFEQGYAILNADDDLVYEMRKVVDSKVALFSMDDDNERVREHCAKNNGLAVIIENGYVVLCEGTWKTRIERVADIPITFKGTAECMIKNILPAVLAGYVSKFSIETIRAALRTFLPSAEHTPGRLNIFHFSSFDVMIDYAHNEDGYRELKKFLVNISATEKVGIVAGVGDRRDEDIRGVGRFAASVFDKIIVRHDKDLRGREKENIEKLIEEGVRQVNQTSELHVIDDELQALDYAMSNARQGSFITICTDSVYQTIDFLKQAKQNDLSVAQQVDPQRYLRAS